MTRRSDLLAGKASALADDDLDPQGWGDAAYPGGVDGDLGSYDGDQLDREERAALRRVAGLSTELQDVTEVEYRQLRLERVVLAGVWTEGTARDAENSIRELAALAETAGSTVLDGRAAAAPAARPGDLPRQGQGPGAARHCPGRRGRHRDLRRRAVAGAASRQLEDVVKVKVIDRTG
jgi:GTP-binding protein HflX